MCSRFWGAVDGQPVLTAMEQYAPIIVDYNKPGPRKQNTAPTEALLAVVPAGEGLKLTELNSWGYTLPGTKQLFINGKIETVLERSLFAKSARERRCILPAEGFFEWRGEKGSKEPILFRRKDDHMLWLAGIWREFEGKTQGLVLTTLPNPLVAEVHDRMPVIVRDEDVKLWLNGSPEEAIVTCIPSLPADEMTATPVDKAVSNPRYDGALHCP